MDILKQIGVGAGVGLLLALTTFATKVRKGEPFAILKLVRTVVIGSVLGGIAGYSEIPITAENWPDYLAANAGVVAFMDQAIKFVVNKISPSE